jgi:glycosyltransferase involved in cell wall biosynthesis
MRILLVHSHYRSAAPSGENQNFRALERILADAGHEIARFERHGDEVLARRPGALLEAALLTPWNPISTRRLATAVREFRPDLVHVENTFPLLSPAVFWTLARMGIPSVAGMHNYRAWCAAAVAYRAGAPCRLCLESGSVLPAIRHGCYKQSRLATAPVAAGIALHRRLRTWGTRPGMLIANSEFLRRSLIEAGIASERIATSPNFVRDPGVPPPTDAREPRVVFVGRLDQEKGAADLIRAWALLPRGAPQLDIIGDGPQRGAVEELARTLGQSERLRFLGQIPPQAVSEHLRRARLLVLPSRCHETFGRGIVEAYAHAVPALAADIGALPELIERGETGELFAPGNIEQLAARVLALFADPAKLARMGQAGRSRYVREYTPQSVLHRLNAIYTRAVQAVVTAH